MLYFSTAAYVSFLLLLVFLTTYFKTSQNYHGTACDNMDQLHLCKTDIITKISVANYGVSFDPEDAVARR